MAEAFVNSEHGSQLSVMYEFYKLGIFCDMKIIVGTKSFYVQKLFLVTCSKYFRDLVTKNPTASEFNLDKIDEETFNKILNYFYEGKLELTKGSVQRLLEAAILFKLDTLTNACIKFLTVQPFTRTLAEKNSKDSQSGDLNKNTRILVIGGENEPIASYVDFYDPNTDTWLETKITELRRTDFGVAILNDRVLVIGGKQARIALNETVAVDLETLNIETLSSLQTNRKNLCIANVYNDFNILYAIGGHDDFQYVNTVEKYNPDENTWSDVSPMAAQRGCFGVAVLNRKIYAVGGINEDGILNTVEVYSIDGDKWSRCKPMNHARYHAGVVALGNCVYAIGGNNDDGAVLSVERYNVENDTWTVLEGSNFPENLKNVSAALYRDDIIVIGGRQAFSYSPENNTWKELSSLSSTRNHSLILAMTMSQ